MSSYACQYKELCKMKGSLKKTATHILYVHENICPHFIFVLLPLMPEGKFKNGQILNKCLKWSLFKHIFAQKNYRQVELSRIRKAEITQGKNTITLYTVYYYRAAVLRRAWTLGRSCQNQIWWRCGLLMVYSCPVIF